MSKYSLADIKADMDKLFAPVTLDLGKEEIVLRNILRVDDAARTKVVEAQKRIQELADEDGEVDDDHMVEYKAQMLAVLAAVATDGEALLKALGEDLALIMRIFAIWAEESQAGEAKRSPEDSTASEAS